VLLLGRRDDVPELLAASDIFVQASQLEGLSRALLEAMRSGLPVVASDVNATRELVRDGETGHLVRVGDEVMLSRRLLELINDPSTAARLGNAARDAAAGSWTISRMGRAHDELYERLLRLKNLL
jgi:glycosyltransferase involved in cell wall biosynthesis